MDVIRLTFMVGSVTAHFIIASCFGPFLLNVAYRLYRVRVNVELNVIGDLRATPAFPTFVPTLRRRHFCIVNDDGVCVSFNVDNNDTITFVRHPHFGPRVRSPPSACMFREACPTRVALRHAEFVRVRCRAKICRACHSKDCLSATPQDGRDSSNGANFCPVKPKNRFQFRIAAFNVLRDRFKRVNRDHFIGANVCPIVYFRDRQNINVVRLTSKRNAVRRLMNFGANKGEP